LTFDREEREILRPPATSFMKGGRRGEGEISNFLLHYTIKTECRMVPILHVGGGGMKKPMAVPWACGVEDEEVREDPACA